LSLQGVASHSLLNHDRVGLDCVGGHVRAPTKLCESRVYDDGGAGGLPHARGPRIPRSGAMICHGMHGSL
jgi:hypothetical protein